MCVECRGVPEVDRDVPPADPPPPRVDTVPAPAAVDATAERPKQPLAYHSTPKPGGSLIEIAPDGAAEIRISYDYDRPWGLVIGFGVLALGLTVFIAYEAIRHGRGAVSGGVVAAAVLLALLALAAAVRGGTPPLHLVASADGLLMRGGVMNETLEWRRDEILAVTAEDLEVPHASDQRISIVVEFRDDEFAVFPVGTHEEQRAIVQALHGALRLPPPPPLTAAAAAAASRA
jgi:hypothetical protein